MENVSKIKHLLLQKFTWTEFFSFLDWWIGIVNLPSKFIHKHVSVETEPQIEAVVIDFSLGATTWFLQNPGEHMLISMYTLISFYPLHPTHTHGSLI